MKGLGISKFAALAACLGLGLLAAPARAQTPPICGDLFENCQIADDVLDWNLDDFSEFFPQDEDTCSKMAEGVLAQCEKAVKSGVKCWIEQFNTIPKNARPVCRTERSPSSVCDVDHKYVAHNSVNDTQALVPFELACCEDAALDFFDACIGDE